MRGQKIFNQIVKNDNLVRKPLRGRNNKLVLLRNECLLTRYYYYGFHKNMCYEETLRELVKEFFLAPVTIANIIQGNTEQLITVRQKGISIYNFSNKWPHLKW